MIVADRFGQHLLLMGVGLEHHWFRRDDCLQFAAVRRLLKIAECKPRRAIFEMAVLKSARPKAPPAFVYSDTYLVSRSIRSRMTGRPKVGTRSLSRSGTTATNSETVGSQSRSIAFTPQMQEAASARHLGNGVTPTRATTSRSPSSAILPPIRLPSVPGCRRTVLPGKSCAAGSLPTAGGILRLVSQSAIDNVGDESAHFRNGMKGERVWRVRGKAELCAAWRANSHDYAGLLGECWIPVPLPPPRSEGENYPTGLRRFPFHATRRKRVRRATQNFATRPSSRQAHSSRQARFSRTDVDGVYEWSLPSAVAAHIQLGHFALSRSAMAAMRASATIPAWSKAVNLPARRRMRPSTITVSTFVGRPSETIAS
jgi:hypothetical protein